MSLPIFPTSRLFYFTLDPFLIMLSVKQRGIKYHFWVFGITRTGIEPRSPWPLASALTIMSRKDHLLLWFIFNNI